MQGPQGTLCGLSLDARAAALESTVLSPSAVVCSSQRVAPADGGASSRAAKASGPPVANLGPPRAPSSAAPPTAGGPRFFAAPVSSGSAGSCAQMEGASFCQRHLEKLARIPQDDRFPARCAPDRIAPGAAAVTDERTDAHQPFGSLRIGAQRSGLACVLARGSPPTTSCAQPPQPEIRAVERYAGRRWPIRDRRSLDRQAGRRAGVPSRRP